MFASLLFRWAGGSAGGSVDTLVPFVACGGGVVLFVLVSIGATVVVVAAGVVVVVSGFPVAVVDELKELDGVEVVVTGGLGLTVVGLASGFLQESGTV